MNLQKNSYKMRLEKLDREWVDVALDLEDADILWDTKSMKNKQLRHKVLTNSKSRYKVCN